MLVRKSARPAQPVPDDVAEMQRVNAELAELRRRQLELESASMQQLGPRKCPSGATEGAQSRRRRQGGVRSSRSCDTAEGAAAGRRMAPSRQRLALALPLSSSTPWPRLPTRDAPLTATGVSASWHVSGKWDERAIVDAAALDPAYVVAWAQEARARVAASGSRRS